MLIFPVTRSSKASDSSEPPGSSSHLKRAIDVSGAALGLLAMIPVFAIIGLSIYLDSPGPIFFKQERVGINRRRGRGIPPEKERRSLDRFGRPIHVYKFRSMVVDAERNTGPVWAASQDNRVTRVGRFLRRTRLDEFPQFWNVLRGEMSLVGPRPERFFFVQRLKEAIPEYDQRCNIMPGVTGLAQVRCGYDSSVESANRKLQYDLHYVRNRSLSLDFKILAQTVNVIVRGDGAR